MNFEAALGRMPRRELVYSSLGKRNALKQRFTAETPEGHTGLKETRRKPYLVSANF